MDKLFRFKVAAAAGYPNPAEPNTLCYARQIEDTNYEVTWRGSGLKFTYSLPQVGKFFTDGRWVRVPVLLKDEFQFVNMHDKEDIIFEASKRESGDYYVTYVSRRGWLVGTVFPEQELRDNFECGFYELLTQEDE